MRRQFLFTLVLLLCVSNPVRRAALRLGATATSSTASDAATAPLSVCRFKKPFPFQAVQLMKKRLSNPPDTQQISLYRVDLVPAATVSGMLMYGDYWLLPEIFINEASVLPGYPATRRYAGGVEQNVFHPPPCVAA